MASKTGNSRGVPARRMVARPIRIPLSVALPSPKGPREGTAHTHPRPYPTLDNFSLWVLAGTRRPPISPRTRLPRTSGRLARATQVIPRLAQEADPEREMGRGYGSPGEVGTEPATGGQTWHRAQGIPLPEDERP